MLKMANENSNKNPGTYKYRQAMQTASRQL